MTAIECCLLPCKWDPEAEGTTCGGLRVRGAWICVVCSSRQIGDETRVAEAWTLTKGGRSIDTGSGRLRLDGGGDKSAALMQRLLRLPELEREVERLRRELAMAVDAHVKHVEEWGELAETSISRNVLEELGRREIEGVGT